MSERTRAHSLLRAAVAGLAGGVAWIVALMIFFGLGQVILADPAYQSQKFLFVMTELEPLPRMVEAWWILPLGVLAIGMVYGIVYHFVRRAFPARAWWKKGLGFGLIAWALMVPWFEFYLPWNVMHEPFLLVLLEMALWLAVLLVVGVTVALVYEGRTESEVLAAVDGVPARIHPEGR